MFKLLEDDVVEVDGGNIAGYIYDDGFYFPVELLCYRHGNVDIDLMCEKLQALKILQQKIGGEIFADAATARDYVQLDLEVPFENVLAHAGSEGLARCLLSSWPELRKAARRILYERGRKDV